MIIIPINLTWRSSLLFLFLISSFLLLSSSIKAQTPPNAWINEIHYDNVSGDVGEGIEVVIENVGEYQLDKFEVTLYSGSSQSPIGEGIYTLSGGVQDPENPSFTIYTLFVSTLQNGPDGIALSYDNALLQFLSYEGSFTATEGVAKDNSSSDIGVSEPASTPVGYSLQLSGEGDRYPTFSWQEAAAGTFGTINNDQIFTDIDGPQPIRDLKQVYIAPDKVQLTWTKPIGVHGEDWSGILLFASEEGSIDLTLNERNHTDFNAGEHIYGNGEKIENSFTVDRRDTDANEPVTITGLNPDKNYHFAAYTSLIVGGNSYDEFSERSEEIIISPAVGEITNLSATPLSEKINLEWNNLMGSKNTWWHHIIIVASESNIASVPGQEQYTANATFGEGAEMNEGDFVVYSGSGEQAFINGLENGLEYYFKVFVRYDKGTEYVWSSGTEIEATPFENKKYWTGSEGNNLFSDELNWDPQGIPGASHDVILDHSRFPDSYTVVFPDDPGGVTLNSLQIVPENEKPITVHLTAEKGEDPYLSLMSNEQPLIIGNYGVLKNSITGTGNVFNIPHEKVTLQENAIYEHHSATPHSEFLGNIALVNGSIPGTILFNTPSSGSVFTSLGGRSFQNLSLGASDPVIYSVTSSSPVTVTKKLIINENATLKMENIGVNLILQGDLVLDGVLQTNNRIIFNGDVMQIISSNNEDPLQFNKMEIHKSSNDLFLEADLRILESLSFSAGNISTGSNKIILDFATTPSLEVLRNEENTSITGNIEVIRHVGTSQTDFPNANLLIGTGAEDLGPVRVVSKTGPDAVITKGDSKSIQRNWEVHPTNPLTGERDLTFSWNADESDALDLQKLKVWKETDTPDEWLPLGDFQDGTALSITATTDKLTRFTIADDMNPLPIELLTFTATAHGTNASLDWITATETNNFGFEIEKSLDGKAFSSIGFERGAGESVTEKKYTFIDHAFSENAYYRLKQVDTNGDFSYSFIRYLPFTAFDHQELLLYPNPINGQVTLSSTTGEEISFMRLYESHGRLLYEWKTGTTKDAEDKFNQIQPNLLRGLYILHIAQGNSIKKIKVVKE